MNATILDNKPSQTNNTNTNNNVEKQSSPNINKNSIREFVRRRRTSDKSYFNIYNKKVVKFDFRASIDYLDKIEFIGKKLRARNISEVIRESIDIVYGLLSGAKEIEAGMVVIQSPVVNIVKAEANSESKAEAKAESRPEINIDLKGIIRLVERLYNLSIDNPHMPPLQRDLIKQLYKKITAVVN